MAVNAKSPSANYAIALGASALALGFAYALLDSRTPFLPCIAAVLMISWRLGRGPGTLSAVFFIVFTTIELFGLSPEQTIPDVWRNVAREGMFAGVCALIIVISSAQRKAEARTLEQAEWLRFALANISNGVIGADAHGKITFLNPMAQRLTGFGDDSIGKPCSEIFKTVSLDSKEVLEDPITMALTGGGADGTTARFDRDVILISRDGRRYIVEDSATALHAPGGTPGHAVLVFRDVTEQRRSENELRIAADRYRLALEVGRLIPWEWNVSSDELIADGFKVLLPGADVPTRAAYTQYMHPDDLDATRTTALDALAQRTHYTVQYRLLPPGGETRWVESHGRPFFNDRGDPVKFVGVLRDVTEQKLVEKIIRDGQEQFRNVAESACDGFVTVDEKGKILYANGSFAELFGYKRSELIGLNLVSLVPEHLRKRHMQGVERFMKTGVKTVNWRQVEFPGLRKDGTEIAIEMSYSETRAGEKRLLSAIVRDVSQRKKDAEAMHTARQRLELAQRIAGLGLFEWQLREGRSTISPELEAMFGLLPGTYDGTYDMWEKIVHPDDLQKVRDNVRLMMVEDHPEYSSIYRVIWPDGSVHWMSSKTKMFRDENGAPVWALGVSLDITREKEAEAERERLLQNEKTARERLQLAHRIAGIGTFEWDAARGETHFSPELETLYGLKPGEFRQTFEHWSKLVHPDDWPRVQANAQRTLKSTGTEYAVEFRVVWPDGSIHWITTKGKLHRDALGKAVRLVGVEQDVTRQKSEAAEREHLLASEKRIRERFELAQRAARIGIHERNIRTGVIQCSPEWLKLTGMTSTTQTCMFDEWIARIHPDDRDHVMNTFAEFSQANTDYYFEYRVIWPDGSIHWVASSGKVLCDAQDQPELAIGASVDITERKALDAQRERILEHEKAARSEAERISQLKDEFLATVSHELRTPLTAILGWTQMLSEGVVEPEMLRRGLDSIARNSRAQAQLVEDLLDVSRVVTGQMRIQIEPLDLAEVVSASVDGIRPAAQAKKVSLVLNLSPARVSADADRLQQVVFNILFNAVKFSNIGGRIEVTVETDTLLVRLTVKDNGKGIAPAFLPNLFERFSQEDGSSTRRHGGMGLGLAIAKHLVELHGGSIRAASDGEGKGTTMTIELPTLRRGDSLILNSGRVAGPKAAMA